MCSVTADNVIAAPNASTIYDVPRIYHEQGLDTQILKYFNLEYNKKIDLKNGIILLNQLKILKARLILP